MRLAVGSSWSGAAIDALRAWNGAGARFQFGWGRYGSGYVSCSEAERPARRRVGLYGLPGQSVRRAHPGRSAVLVSRRSNDGCGRRFQPHPDDHGQRRSAMDRLQSDDINGIRAIYGSDRPRGTPDLVVRSGQTSPRTLTAGRTFTLSATVRNVGDGTSASSTLRYYYYRSSSQDWVVVGTDSVRGLAPSGSSFESIRLTAPSRAGTHYYNVCVAAVRGERNTSNCSGKRAGDRDGWRNAGPGGAVCAGHAAHTSRGGHLSLLKHVWVGAGPVRCLHSRGTASR